MGSCYRISENQFRSGANVVREMMFLLLHRSYCSKAYDLAEDYDNVGSSHKRLACSWSQLPPLRFTNIFLFFVFKYSLTFSVC